MTAWDPRSSTPAPRRRPHNPRSHTGLRFGNRSDIDFRVESDQNEIIDLTFLHPDFLVLDLTVASGGRDCRWRCARSSGSYLVDERARAL
jgi:hypothetical protein